MKIWLGLLVSPSIALACQAILFALATPSCSTQSRVEMHAVAAASLLLTLAFTVAARARWSTCGSDMAGADADHSDAGTTRAFLGACATAVSALSALAVFTLWVVTAVLSPCAQ